MRVFWEDQLISLPHVGETLTTFIACMNALPEKLTGLLASITNGIGNDLTCPTTNYRPKPAFLPWFQHR
jgi:hypothetical protein